MSYPTDETPNVTGAEQNQPAQPESMAVTHTQTEHQPEDDMQDGQDLEKTAVSNESVEDVATEDMVALDESGMHFNQAPEPEEGMSLAPEGNEVEEEAQLAPSLEQDPVEITGEALPDLDEDNATGNPEVATEEALTAQADEDTSTETAPDQRAGDDTALVEEPSTTPEQITAGNEDAFKSSESETIAVQAEETLAPEATLALKHEEEGKEPAAGTDSLPETSLNEEVDEQAETEAAKDEDFSGLSRKDLVRRLQDMSQQAKISDPLLRKIKQAYDEQLDTERNVALTSFRTEGGAEEDFEFRKDADAIEFEQSFRLLREKRKVQLDEIDKTKRINLKQKQQLLEDLKALNDQEESNGSLEEIKRIMEKWRATGPVPHADAQELFKNFDFQVDKFYSRRTEFFEMKELDRKRNLERKTALLERAKRTMDEPVFVNGLREYNKIFEEFRNTGPAPRDENERLYAEIKAIGTQLYDKKKTYDEAQRVEAEKVAAVRQGLLTQMDVVSSFTSETIGEWQSQTDLVQKLIGEWKGAGSRYRDQDPEVSKRFWAGLKKFYGAKDAFFKKLDKERAENMAKKREILAQVQELAGADTKQRNQAELNQLVASWKEIGPVAFKDRDKLNKEFSKALDVYYEARRSTVSAEQGEQRENLAKKQAGIDRLNALIAEKKGTEEELREIQREFAAVGFVPFKKKDEINAAFKDAFVKAVEQTSEVSQNQKSYLKLEAIRGGGRGGDNRGGGRPFGGPRGGASTFNREPQGPRGVLTKRIAGLETDVRNYRTNMDFIASSKNGDKLKAEFNDRIHKAEEEINVLRLQLKEMEKTSEEAK